MPGDASPQGHRRPTLSVRRGLATNNGPHGNVDCQGLRARTWPLQRASPPTRRGAIGQRSIQVRTGLGQDSAHSSRSHPGQAKLTCDVTRGTVPAIARIVASTRLLGPACTQLLPPKDPDRESARTYPAPATRRGRGRRHDWSPSDPLGCRRAGKNFPLPPGRMARGRWIEEPVGGEAKVVGPVTRGRDDVRTVSAQQGAVATHKASEGAPDARNPRARRWQVPASRSARSRKPLCAFDRSPLSEPFGAFGGRR